jgi:TolB-like protein
MNKITYPFLLLTIVSFFTINLHAQNTLDKEIQGIVDQLGLKLNEDHLIKSIAVADFTNLNGVPTELGKFLSEEFLYALSNLKSSFSVIDRSRVNALLKEAGLDAKGLLDPGAASKLGRLKAIDVIIVGTMTADGNYIRVTVKAIKLESASIVAAARGEISRTPTINDLEAKELNAGPNTTATAPQSPSSTNSQTSKTQAAAQQKVEAATILFELIECRQSGQNIECAVRITSESKDLDLSVYFEGTRIIDANGGIEKSVNGIKLADKSATNAYQVIKSLVTGVPITGRFIFTGINEKVDTISKMELRSYSGHQGEFFTAVLRNIPVKQ